MIKKNSFIKISFVLIACLTLVLTGVLSIVNNNNNNNVVSADSSSVIHTYTGSNIVIPVNVQDPIAHESYLGFLDIAFSFTYDSDFDYKRLSFNSTLFFDEYVFTTNVLDANFTFNVDIDIPFDNGNYVVKYKVLSDLYSPYNFLPTNVFIGVQTINNFDYNSLVYRDNTGHYLSFNFYVAGFNYSLTDRVYFLTTDFDENEFYNNGWQVGYDNGLSAGYDNGYNAGSESGYNNGYAVGFHEGTIQANDYTWFGLIAAVIDAPLIAITSLFNFDLMGVNLLGFITALLTLAVVLFIIRFAWLK